MRNIACCWLRKGAEVELGETSVILNVCLWLLEKWYWIWKKWRTVKNHTDNLVLLLGFTGVEINRRGWGCLRGLAWSHITLRSSWANTKTFSSGLLSIYDTMIFPLMTIPLKNTIFLFVCLQSWNERHLTLGKLFASNGMYIIKIVLLI